MQRCFMAMSNSVKKVCKRIGTHNGVFHCDDVVACFLLKQLPDFRDAEIVRSRDEKVLGSCDIVVDVGGVYNYHTHRFDHHQREFNESLGSVNPKYDKLFSRTKLSSAGLVWCHFGEDILRVMLHLPPEGESQTVDHQVEVMYQRLYERFIEEIDAFDNGINPYETEPRFYISTTISQRVANLNPPWNSEHTDDNARLKCFMKAMAYAGSEFTDRLDYVYHSWLPARDLVKMAIQHRHEVDEGGEIIKFGAGKCPPWKDHLYALEPEMGLIDVIKFALFQDTQGSWRVQAVNRNAQTFELRCPLPKAWRGLRNAELSSVSGIPDTIFVHSSGFIGGADSYASVLTMAKKTLHMYHAAGENKHI